MQTYALVLLILVGVIALCCVSCCLSNCMWRKKQIAHHEEKAKIAQTKLGPVEYSIKGEAPYILCLHGTAGMQDSVCCFFDHLLDKGFGTIVPSRPGYGRTPNVQTYEEVADVIAALLTSIGISQVACVYGISGGGPCSIMFAARHPHMAKCLLTECAVTGKFTCPQIEGLGSYGVRLALTSITASRLSPYAGNEFILKELLKNESTYTPEQIETAVQEILADQIRLNMIPKFLVAAQCTMMYTHSVDTMIQELEMYKVTLPLEKVTLPTLITHGTSDKDVNFSQAEQAHKLIPGSELLTIEGGMHLNIFHAKGQEMIQTQADFIKKHNSM